MTAGRPVHNSISNERKWMISTILAVLLIAVASPWALAQGQESITTAWKSPVNQPICLAMSAGGKYFGSVDADGTVRFYDHKGSLLWKQHVENATNVLIARNGESLLVYSRMNPKSRHIYFFRKDGRRLWRHEVEGNVWSGAISHDGTHAAVTTSDRYIYIYTPHPTRPTFKRWRLNGIGYHVGFMPDNKNIVLGTWQESALVCYNTNGDFQWKNRYGTDRQFELCISADGKRILGVIPGTQNDPGIEFRFWDSSGKMLWKRSVDDFDARALTSPKSQYVAISYASLLSRESGVSERKVAVYDANGQPLWDKGGLFFGPRLVALSPTGSSVIVTDGERSLFNIDKRGRILSKHTLGGTVRRTVSSEDGSRVLLYCGDGWLYLMHIG